VNRELLNGSIRNTKAIQELSDIILDVTRCGSGKLNFGKE